MQRAAEKSLAVMCGWPPRGKRKCSVPPRSRLQSCVDGPRLARGNAACRTEVACSHVWIAPAWREGMQRGARKSLAVLCGERTPGKRESSVALGSRLQTCEEGCRAAGGTGEWGTVV